MNGLRLSAAAVAAIAAGTPAAPAQTFAEAVRANMALAMHVCLSNVATVDRLHATFLAAGFAYEAEDFGGGPDDILHWYHAPADTVFVGVVYERGATDCRVTSGQMGVTEAVPFAGAVLEQLAPGLFRAGGPGGQAVVPGSPNPRRAACSGYTGQLPGRTVWVEIGNSGQDPTCTEDGTVQIILHM
jgi:hypothetical protein